MKITKRFHWVMGHRLNFHKGGCENIHGHNYECKVTIEGVVDERGFVMDFADLKKEVMIILDMWDHSFMWYKHDAIMNLIFQDNSNLKNCPMPFQPTAENIAKELFETLRIKQLNVTRVKVYETPTSEAVYYG